MTRGTTGGMSWKDWAGWYADLFGLVTDRDAAMIASWIREVFAPQGFSPDELKAAGQVVARSDPPRFREQHLARLSAEVRAARAAARPKFTPESDWTECRDCGGTGLVSVPTPHSRTAWAMTALICPCPAGDAFKAATRPDWMTLEQYEAHWPLWRDVVERWRDEQRAYERAAGHSRDADRTLGAIVDQLAGRGKRRNP